MDAQRVKYVYRWFRNSTAGGRTIKEGRKLRKDPSFTILKFQMINILLEFETGIENKQYRPSTPIKNVICNVYGNEEI